MLFDSLSTEAQGSWWTADNDKLRLPGYLKLTNDGPSLHLLEGGFVKDGKTDRHPTLIHGITTRSESVTLHDCHSYSVQQTGITYGMVTAYVGRSPLKSDELLFTSMAVEFDRLVEWVRFQHIGTQGSGYTVLDTPAFKADCGDFTLTLSHSPEFSHNHYHGTISVKAVIIVRPKQPQSLDWYASKAILPLQNLLSLFKGKLTTLSACVGTRGEPDAFDRFSIAAWGLTFPETRESSYYFPLVEFDGIKDSFEAVLQTWFKGYEDVRPAIELYSALIGEHRGLLSNQCLMLSAALEVYHRRKHKGTYLDPKQYEKVKAALNSAIPSWVDKSLKDALKSRIKYGNEYALRKSMGLLLERHLALVKVTEINDVEKFVKRWVDTRNFLTHFDPELKDTMLAGPDLLLAVDIMHVLLEQCLLGECGLKDTVLRTALRTSVSIRGLHPVMKPWYPLKQSRQSK